MNRIIGVTLIASLMQGALFAKESESNGFKAMFEDAKVSGNIRVAYGSYDYKESGVVDSYATAIGGILKYELAAYKGFNAGVAFYTSHDIDGLSGDGNHHNSDFSSSKGSYTEVGEAYINYKYDDFNIRVGRQVIDTPLADSDDARVVPNSFNAVVATYNYNNIEFMAGNIQSWQGSGTGLDDGWVNIGDHGINFGGISYSDQWELSAWYYNITENTNAFYLEGGIEYSLKSDLRLHFILQYLNEEELDNSGYAADIYGTALEATYKDFGLNFAYNRANREDAKESFSGVGGGTLFTNMDTMIIDEITQDREAEAYVGTLSYTYGDYSFSYAYGDFSAKANGAAPKAHIVEQDIALEYAWSDDFSLSAIYVISDDKAESSKSEYDFDRAQITVNYNF